MAFVAERVAPYKKVRRLEFVDQIPKSPSGKILRRVLVERERAAVAQSGLKRSRPWSPRSVARCSRPAASLTLRQQRWPRSSASSASSSARCGSSRARRSRSIATAGSSSTSPAGYADTQRGEPVGPDTLFPLFSGTKPFASVALWQQIERGQRTRRSGRRPLAGVRPERQGPRAGPPRPLPPRRLPDDAAGADAGPLGRLGERRSGRSRPCRSSTSRARSAPTTS